MAIWDDARVRRGMERQLELRARMLDGGAQPIGWKLGLGTAAAMEALGTDGPLVGFLTDRTLLRPGATVALAGWTNPMLECEIAVRLGRDVPGDADRDAAAAAVDAVAPAIELADVAGPRDDPEAILAGDVFHRHVLLGDWDTARAGLVLDGVTLGVDGVVEGADPQAVTGDLAELVRHTAAALAAFGERLRAGDAIITGAAIPPLPVAPGDAVACRFAGLGTLGVTLS